MAYSQLVLALVLARISRVLFYFCIIHSGICPTLCRPLMDLLRQNCEEAKVLIIPLVHEIICMLLYIF